MRVRFVVRQQGGLCERVRDGELEEVRVCLEGEEVVVDAGEGDVRVVLRCIPASVLLLLPMERRNSIRSWDSVPHSDTPQPPSHHAGSCGA